MRLNESQIRKSPEALKTTILFPKEEDCRFVLYMAGLERLDCFLCSVESLGRVE